MVVPFFGPVGGIMCSALGALFGATSKCCLKLAHNLKARKVAALAGEKVEGTRFASRFCPRSPRLALTVGIVLIPTEVRRHTSSQKAACTMHSGPYRMQQVVADLCAFYLAPQRLISPLSGLVVVANLFIARVLLGEVAAWQVCLV